MRRDRNSNLISISCIPKIDALIEKFGLSEDGRNVDTPMSKDFMPTSRSHEVTREGTLGSGTPLPAGNRYCELIGSLLYIANTTRPDISQAVGVLSRYRMTPTTAHWSKGIRVLRYLKSTREHVLVLGGTGPILEGGRC